MQRLADDPGDDEYLDAVMKETLRVRPVISDIARKLTRDIDLAGYRIPAGTLVLIAIAALHVRPDLYPDPHAFRPERFLGEGAPESYSWVPFGGGVGRGPGGSCAAGEEEGAQAQIVARV